MTKQRVLLLVAVVVILISLVLIFRRTARPAAPDLLGFSVVGEVAAEETARLLNGQGGVAVIFVDPSGGGLPGMEVVQRALAKKLRQGTGLRITSEDVVSYGAQELSRQVVELVKKRAAADAIVIVGGTTKLHTEDFTSLPKSHPKLVSVLAFGPGEVLQLFETETLGLAVTSRVREAPVTTGALSVRDSFAAQFVVVTATNTDELVPEQPDR